MSTKNIKKPRLEKLSENQKNEQKQQNDKKIEKTTKQGKKQKSVLGGYNGWEYTEKNQKNSLCIAAWNTLGLYGKEPFVEKLLEQNDLIMLFETMTSDRAKSYGRYVVNQHCPREPGLRAHYGIATALSDGIDKNHVTCIKTRDDTSYTIVKTKGVTIIGIYLKPTLKNEECLAIIEEIFQIVKPVDREKMVLIGDFNMRLGKLTGDRVANSRGIEIHDKLTNLGLNLCEFADERMTYIGVGKNGTTRSSRVDLAYVSNKLFTRSKVEIKVHRDRYGSDHHPISIVILLEENQEPVSNPKIAFYKLKNQKIRDNFIRIATPRLEEVDCFIESTWRDVTSGEITWSPRVEALLDGANERLTDALMTTAKETCGLNNPKEVEKFKDDPKIKELKNKRNILLRRIRNLTKIERETTSNFSREKGEIKAEVKNVLKGIKSRVFEIRTERRNNFHEKLEKCNHSERSKMMGIMLKFSNNNGSLDEDKIEEYRMGKQQVFLPIPGMPYEEEELKEEFPNLIATTALSPEDEATLNQIANPIFIEQMIRKCPNGKAPGLSGLMVEAIKPLKSHVAQVMAKMINIILRTGLIPKAWKCATMILIPKKPGAKEVGDLRPIALTEVLRRIFERCIFGWIRRELGDLPIEQGGFRQGRSTLHQVATLDTMLRKRKQDNQKTHLAFLDIKAAYDTVCRNILWKKCAGKGASTMALKTLKALFNGCFAHIVIKYKMSEALAFKLGLMQGSSLSPLLYTIYMEDLILELRELPKLPIGETAINSIWFADDIALISENKETLQMLLVRCEEHSFANRYRFGVSKCEAISGEATSEEDGQSLKLYGGALKNTETFKYLGIMISREGIYVKQSLSRNQEAFEKQIVRLRALGVNIRNYPLNIVLAIFKTFARPVLEYGVACFPQFALWSNKIEHIYYGGLLSLIGIDRTISREKLNALTEEPRYMSRLRELRFRFGALVKVKDATHLFWHAKLTTSGNDHPELAEYLRKFEAATFENPDIPLRKLLKSTCQQIMSEEKTMSKSKFTGLNKKTLARMDNLGRKRKLLILWTLGKIPFAGRDCQLCGEEGRLGKRHIEEVHLPNKVGRLNFPIGLKVDNLLTTETPTKEEIENVAEWMYNLANWVMPPLV